MKGHHVQQGRPKLLAGQGIGVMQPGRGDVPALRDRPNGQIFLKTEPKQFDALNSPEVRPSTRSASMDLRTYGIGAQILKDLGVGKMKLLASPRKMPSMTGFDLEVVGYQARPNT